MSNIMDKNTRLKKKLAADQVNKTFDKEIKTKASKYVKSNNPTDLNHTIEKTEQNDMPSCS